MVPLVLQRAGSWKLKANYTVEVVEANTNARGTRINLRERYEKFAKFTSLCMAEQGLWHVPWKREKKPVARGRSGTPARNS